jgi:MraZ protein
MPEATLIRTYSGLYFHSVDEKRRTAVPFRWRPEESTEFTILIWGKHAAGKCLRVMPPEQWAKLWGTIDAMRNGDAMKTYLKRKMGTDSIQVKLDSAGRIAIPENMATEANLTNQAVLAGMMDKFEIWSPDRYKTSLTLDSGMEPQCYDLLE